MPSRKIPKSEYPEIVAMYLLGLTNEEIADVYDVSQQAIWRILHKPECKRIKQEYTLRTIRAFVRKGEKIE